MKENKDTLNKLLSKSARFISSRRYRETLLFTFIFSMAANAFAYFNLYPQHDSINHMFEFAGVWEISLGRFLLPYYGQFQGQITAPWMIGVLSIFLISLTVYCVCTLLELTSTGQICAVSGVLSANLCITELASVYTWTLPVYMLSALLGVMGVYILERMPSVARYPAAVLCFTCSLGLYQAEITFGITLIAILALKDLLNGEKTSAVILKYIKIGIALVCSAVLYFLLYKLMLRLHNVEPANSYNSLSNIKNITPLELLLSIKKIYKAFIAFFFGDKCFVGVTVTRTCNILLTLLAFIVLGISVVKRKTPMGSVALIGAILLVLPALICLFDIFMSKNKLSFYLLYSLYLYYILLIYLLCMCGNFLSEKRQGILKLVLSVCMCLIIFQNVVYSNQVYSYQKIMYDRSVSITSRILDSIESEKEYVIGQTEVVMVGELRKNQDLSKTLRIDETLPKNLQNNLGIRELVNETGLNIGKVSSITYNQTFDSFAWLLGSEVYNQTDADIVRAYTTSEEVRNMPAFPHEGYCKMIDGRMVVKLS